jgi:hypothetical protein
MNIAGLFGKKKKEEPKSKQSKAIQSIGELDKGIQDLEAQIDFNEKRANAIQEEAKAKLKAGDKNGAKKLLVKRKRHLEQIKNYEGALSMMEQQKMMLESADAMGKMYGTLSNATSALKDIQKDMDVEKLEKMREDMEDIKDTQNEMKEFFAEYANEDMEGIEDDLKELEDEIDQDDKVELPDANKNKIHQPSVEVKNDDEKELEGFLD